MFNTNVEGGERARGLGERAAPAAESDAWLLKRLLHDECLRFSELHIVRPNTVV
jgi:hypothetical protein